MCGTQQQQMANYRVCTNTNSSNKTTQDKTKDQLRLFKLNNNKGKVVPVLRAMKTYGEVGVFLTSTLVGSE
jgi:hypothetical protein